MRVLLDHCIDWRLGRSLPAHAVSSTRDMGWEELSNGTLLARAAGDFDVIITVDQNIKREQNLRTLPISIIVLIARSNRLADLAPFAPMIEEALARLVPQTLVELTLAAA